MSDSMTIDAVKVRMYKRLLGDCFLIRIEGEKDGKPASSNLMIDCGVLQGTPGAGMLMDGVVDSIYDTTGDAPLDLIVVTHEHHDHISGFSLARDRFETRKVKGDAAGARVARDKAVDQVWFAWTEDPTDEDARKYQAQYGHAFHTLVKLAEHLDVPRGLDETKAEHLGLVGFSGALGAAGTDPKGKPLRGSRAIYSKLREWAGEGGTRYLSPGQVVTTPGALGLKAYVLGPPRDQAMLTKALPSAGAKAETYLAMAGGGDPAAAQGQSPFSPIYRWRSDKEIKAATRRDPALPAGADDPAHWLHSLYYAENSPCSGSQHKRKEGPTCRGSFTRHEPQKHRMLDDVARSIFSNLSLRMDSNTNNTSLVLAFELPEDAGTMIFAADAQVGNWLSWDTVKFRDDPKAKDPLPITSTDLLARARLYKVGHHGSHNATLAAKGLDLMSDDLVALIPTDAKFALEQSSGWLMPNPRVEAALLAKTRRRVLRGDRPAKEAIDAYRKETDVAAADAFKACVDEQKLPDGTEWVEYTVYQRRRSS